MEIRSILEEDFTVLTESYDFSFLKNRSVLVTGATGLLGSQLLKYMRFLNKRFSYGIRLYALARSESKVSAVFNDGVYEKEDISFVFADVLKLPPIDFSIDYIIHGASITSSKSFVDTPVETIDIAINGTMNILELAKAKNIKGMVYLSSMEVFGTTSPDQLNVKESDLGYIDILSPRSSYSESKRMCECLCTCYMAEYKVPVKIVRLTQTLGAGIDYNDTRVAAQFARAVLEKRNIILKTKGLTKRPVLYTRDALSAILTVLDKGKNGEAYTAANPKTFCTISETAQMIADKVAHGNISVEYNIKEVPAEYAPNLNLNLNLNVDKLMSLGWKPTVDLQDAYQKMIDSMQKKDI